MEEKEKIYDFEEIEVVENKEEIVSDVIEEIQEPKQPKKSKKIKIVKVVGSANIRLHPNNNSRLIRRARNGAEFELVEEVKGRLVKLSDTWYKVEDGFIHSSQCRIV
jgi:hypothetical protein